MFEQRGRPAQEPLCFRLPQSVNDPIKLEIISEKVLGSKKAPLLLRVVKKAREDREENGTDTWTVDFLRETLKGSNNLYKPVTSKLIEIKFFSKKQRGLAVGENWDCPDEVLEIAARELADGKIQSSVRLSKSDGPSDGKGDKQGLSSAETNPPLPPSQKRRTGTNKTLSLGEKIKSFFKGEQK